MNLPQLMPALITPFTRTGVLDLDAHRHNVVALCSVGIEGLLLGGSTGEGPMLERGERSALCTAARDLGGGIHLMVGINAESTRQALEQIDEAARAKADAVLVLGPVTLARNSVDAQRRFFTAIADRSPLPTLLYSVPRNTGYSLDESLAIGLAGHPNIVGMKDSGGEAARIGRIARATGPGFAVFSGATASVALSIAGGAHGAITASTNYIPLKMSELVRASHASRADHLALQDAITVITSRIESGGVGFIKAAAREAGLRAGHPRHPFVLAPRAWSRTIGPLVDHIPQSSDQRLITSVN